MSEENKEKISEIWKNLDKYFLPYLRVTGLSIFWILYKYFKSGLVVCCSFLFVCFHF